MLVCTEVKMYIPNSAAPTPKFRSDGEILRDFLDILNQLYSKYASSLSGSDKALIESMQRDIPEIIGKELEIQDYQENDAERELALTLHEVAKQKMLASLFGLLKASLNQSSSLSKFWELLQESTFRCIVRFSSRDTHSIRRQGLKSKINQNAIEKVLAMKEEYEGQITKATKELHLIKSSLKVENKFWDTMSYLKNEILKKVEGYLAQSLTNKSTTVPAVGLLENLKEKLQELSEENIFNNKKIIVDILLSIYFKVEDAKIKQCMIALMLNLSLERFIEKVRDLDTTKKKDIFEQLISTDENYFTTTEGNPKAQKYFYLYYLMAKEHGEWVYEGKVYKDKLFSSCYSPKTQVMLYGESFGEEMGRDMFGFERSQQCEKIIRAHENDRYFERTMVNVIARMFDNKNATYEEKIKMFTEMKYISVPSAPVLTDEVVYDQQPMPLPYNPLPSEPISYVVPPSAPPLEFDDGFEPHKSVNEEVAIIAPKGLEDGYDSWEEETEETLTTASSIPIIMSTAPVSSNDTYNVSYISTQMIWNLPSPPKNIPLEKEDEQKEKQAVPEC